MTIETIVRMVPTVQALQKAMEEAPADWGYFLRASPEQLVAAAAYHGAARCLWHAIVSSVCTRDDLDFERQTTLTDGQIDDMMRVADVDKIWIRIRMDVLCESILSADDRRADLRAELERLVAQLAYEAGVPSVAEMIAAFRAA